MCEVAYLVELDATDPAYQYTLYRAVLAPIGETTPAPTEAALNYPVGWNITLFDGNYLGDDPADTLAYAAARVRTKAVALATGVLHFEVRCWSQYTTTWDDNLWAPTLPFKWVDPWTPRSCGPRGRWNHDEPITPTYPHDDWFARAIMVVVVVDPFQQFPEPVPPYHVSRLMGQHIGQFVVADQLIQQPVVHQDETAR